MTATLSRTSNSISIASLWELIAAQKLNFDPPFQRRSVWDPGRRGFFIDSLLRNYPIPPVFLRQHIDQETGATSYEVVDGKQRLQSIQMFIENQIRVVNESERDSDGEFVGKLFSEFTSASLIETKKRFWRYQVPVEYIDTSDEQLLNEVFDRLNRNGVPLSGQELRRARYHGTPFANLVRDIAQSAPWTQWLPTIVDRNRFEDEEFIADICFIVLNEEVTTTEGAAFEEQFRRAVDAVTEDRAIALKRQVNEYTAWLLQAGIDLDALGLRGISHIYGLWSLAYRVCKGGVQLSPNDAEERIATNLGPARAAAETGPVRLYFQSTNSRTRSKAQRRRRLDALCEIVEIPKPGEISVEMFE